MTIVILVISIYKNSIIKNYGKAWTLVAEVEEVEIAYQGLNHIFKIKSTL